MNRRWIGSTWVALGVLLVVFTATKASAAESVRYLTWNEHTGRAIIETPAGTRQIELGDVVAGYGTVIELDPTRIVLLRVLSGAERELLVARGFADYPARELEVIREDLTIQQIPAP